MTGAAAPNTWFHLAMDLQAGIRARIEQIVSRAQADGRVSSTRDFSLRAGLGKGHVRAIINGEMEPSFSTLERIATFGQVTLEYLIFGREELPARPLASEVDAHRSPAFGPAARAFLELRAHSVEAAAVVREMLGASFNEAHDWTADEWFEELVTAHKVRSRGLRRSA